MQEKEHRWIYERGEHRHKHCWGKEEPGFIPSGRGEVGKCPKSIQDEEAQRLLDTGIPFYAREGGNYPSSIFAVRQGVIYEAVPTRPGHSYHGYPWRGTIPESILEQLKKRAEAEGYDKEFKQWVKRYKK